VDAKKYWLIHTPRFVSLAVLNLLLSIVCYFVVGFAAKSGYEIPKVLLLTLLILVVISSLFVSSFSIYGIIKRKFTVPVGVFCFIISIAPLLFFCLAIWFAIAFWDV
jgi:hypothetical protein